MTRVVSAKAFTAPTKEVKIGLNSVDNTGGTLLEEALKQLCIIKSSNYSKWFEYMLKYNSECFGHPSTNCVDEASIPGIDKYGVNKCQSESWSGADKLNRATNSKLEEAKANILQLQPLSYPSIYINGHRYEVTLC
jgi:hypothetical protein